MWTSNSRANGRPVWTFDGRVGAPTFGPSVRVFTPEHVDDGKRVPEGTLCHHFVRAGKIQFLADCAHPLAGQTVDMAPMPGEDEYHLGDD